MVERIESVDTIRLLAIFAVIVIHTRPFLGSGALASDQTLIGDLLNESARFAVPFFFAISGYFYGLRTAGGSTRLEAGWRMLRRIGTIYIAWNLIYLLPFDARRYAGNG